MTSLNNYYNFLKDNNIDNIDKLKEYLSTDNFKLKFKEGSDIVLIYNNNDSNINDNLVKFFNGVIIKKDTLKVLCYTFDKCPEETTIDNNFTNNNCKIQPVYEGTLIRLFYHDNKWNISTKKMINAFNAKWTSKKTFGEMFLDIFGHDNFNTKINSILQNTNYCYSFLMGHTENNIIQNQGNYIIHLNTIDLINNCEVQEKLPDLSNNKIKHIDDYGIIEFNMNYDQLVEHIKNIKNDNGLNEIGYMLINQNGNRQKFMKNIYSEIRELWGNTNNRLFRYLHLRKNPDKLKKYLDIFKNDKTEFLNYENYLMNVATLILNIYRNRHISKQITKVPFYIRDIIYKVHGMYLQTKNKVSFQDINVVLHDLDEKKFCYIINNIEKDKKKLEQQKAEETQEQLEDTDQINNSDNIESEVQEMES